ncbi:RNA-binding domain-containing protein [Mucor ambiguus]|uniref:Multiple RNA-binding domain-containing protein 1 n=1 Tax=Mucor ambiguus TaxID=91626 RepID=A0A0C9N5E5_9FUNG|nr:RNA-binding domain-containing protein [Mucor ambiguus]
MLMEMSRLIVKNLPKELSEEKFREHFAKKGEVTDAKLMKTQWGVSRKFGFIGYKTEAAAEAAMKYFDNTYINTSRIHVEKAIAYGSDNLPRAWSKYSEGSSAHDRMTGASKKKAEFAVEETDAFHDKQRKEREEFISKLNAEKSDPKLKEYLDVMSSRSKSKTWANDDSAAAQEEKAKEDTSTKVDYHGSDDELYDDLPPKNDTKKTDKEDVDMDKNEGDEEEEDSMEVDGKEKKSKKTTATTTASEPAAAATEVEDAPAHTKSDNPKELIEDTGRLFVRNLSYACTEQDLRDLFEQYGTLSEVHMPIARDTKKSKGYAYILYLLPEHALKAYEALDMKTFQGRLLHIIPAEEKPPAKEEDILGVNGTKLSAVKKDKEKKRRNLAGNDFNWNSLYMSADAIAESIADRLGVDKSEVLNADADNMAVRLALAETQIVNETKEFFEKHGIVLDNFGKKERSETIILVKNIPYGTSEEDMRELFGKYGELGRVLVPPAKTIAVVEFLEPSESRNAFKSLAYRRYKDSLIYLEKAPSNLFKDKFVRDSNAAIKKSEAAEAKPSSAADLLQASDDTTNSDDITTLFVKNLNFSTTAEALRNSFKGITGYRSSRINVKPDAKHPGKTLSMGFGFVEFDSKSNAEKALKALQGFNLDGHTLELKLSHRKADTSSKKSSKTPETTKLVVRNVPFEATDKDLRELFGAYGQLKSLRMPKKFNGGHRGFAFLDFLTKQEAKNVYDNMGNIHLYGRHLVLEWAQEEDNVDSLREKTGKHYSKEEQIGGRVNKRQKVDLDGDDDMLE